MIGRVLREAWVMGGQRERRKAYAAVRAELSPELRALPHQWLGRLSGGCHATHHVHEGCDFSCTACYLASSANRTPPLAFGDVCAQLDAIRAAAGPGGNVQITAGEVTLLPVEDLARIIRYARAIGLDPMVMTHGQTFHEDEGYLETLQAAGLEKIAVHVDHTQRGRKGVARGASEKDLMSVRDSFGEIVRRAKGRGRFHAAHTVTVTQDNLADVPAIVEWALDNSDAFRMLSFQPTASVGRTREGRLTAGAAAVWAQIERGAGQSLNSHTLTLGHHDCNRTCLFFVVNWTDHQGAHRRLVEVNRSNEPVDARFFDTLLRPACEALYFDGADGPTAVGRALGLALRDPRHLWEVPAYGLYRAFGERAWLPAFIAAAARGNAQVRPFAVIVHSFMSSDELSTERGKERLAACAFKVPVDGEMVSMCQLNGSDLRSELDARAQGQLVTARRHR